MIANHNYIAPCICFCGLVIYWKRQKHRRIKRQQLHGNCRPETAAAAVDAVAAADITAATAAVLCTYMDSHKAAKSIDPVRCLPCLRLRTRQHTSVYIEY